MKLTLFIFILLSVLPMAYAETNEAPKDPHHTGTLSSLNLGIRYSSVLQSRGVILYDGFQIDPVVALFFFNDKVEFLGDSIDYRDFIAKDWLRFRTRFSSLTDQPLFPAKDSIKANSPHRPDTYTWSNSLEFFLPGYRTNYTSEIDLTYSKDISASGGNSIDLQGKFKITDFWVPLSETKIEPNLYASLGWGDTANNRYFYGPSAKDAGLNQFSYGLWFAFPEEADRYYPIIQLKHFQTLGSYASAEYALGRNNGWLLSFIATYGVLE